MSFTGTKARSTWRGLPLQPVPGLCCPSHSGRRRGRSGPLFWVRKGVAASLGVGNRPLPVMVREGGPFTPCSAGRGKALPDLCGRSSVPSAAARADGSGQDKPHRRLRQGHDISGSLRGPRSRATCRSRVAPLPRLRPTAFCARRTRTAHACRPGRTAPGVPP